MKNIIAMDLFAGAGGLSEGLEQAGFNVAVANETNEWAAMTYAKNHPETILVRKDLRKVRSTELVRLIGKKPLLITGGPPCQGFSMAGRRRIGDPRSHLFFEFLKKIKEIRPKFILAENVIGLLTFAQGSVIKRIEKELQEMDYHVSKRILNASDFGVPQSRKRLFIFGSLGKKLDINDMKIRKIKKVSVKDAIDDLSFLGMGESSVIYKKNIISPYQKRMRGGRKKLYNHQSSNHRNLIMKRFSKLKAGKGMCELSHRLKTKKRNLMRLKSNTPAPTITTIPDDYVHYDLDRTLTVRECARIQSFCDNYVFLGGRTTGGIRRLVQCPQYTQVGNAVPPFMAKWIGRWILKHSW